MSVFRAFIAVDLPSDVLINLDHVQQKLKLKMKGLPIRWVPVENAHVTLKFLGEVSVKNVKVLEEIMKVTADNYDCLTVSVGGSGAFPNGKRPRVLWAGMEITSDFYAVQRAIELETTRLGYKSEKRPFSPHLTLGRVSRNASSYEVLRIGEAMERVKVGFIGVAQLKEIFLYRSELNPGGAQYSRVASVNFRDCPDP